MKFTKEEISLCKQVAKRYMKPLEYGSWYEFEGNMYLVVSKDGGVMDDTVTPLWTISDCLEFLEKKGYGRIISFIHYIFLQFGNRCWTFTAENIITSNNFKRARGEKANTKLEACLKAVLVVLEDKA